MRPLISLKEKTMKFRHGDVILSSVDSIPKGAKPIRGLVVAEGEVTGHSHRIEFGPGADPGAALFELGGQRYASLSRDSAIVHEEHNRLELPAGTYSITIQREYDDESEWRQVAD